MKKNAIKTSKTRSKRKSNSAPVVVTPPLSNTTIFSVFASVGNVNGKANRGGKTIPLLTFEPASPEHQTFWDNQLADQIPFPETRNFLGRIGQL